MTCDKCNKATVPYVVHESEMGRMDRIVKKMWILIILLVVLLVGSNLAWIIYESQFVDQYVEQEIDTGDGDAYVAGIGDVNYGEGQADSP